MKEKNQKQAFTLIELLMVVAIIGILTAIAVGVAGLANRKSADAKVRAQLQQISDALEEYRLVYGEYPNALTVMSNASTKIEIQYKKLPANDLWNTAYAYTVMDTNRLSYTLKSLGPDRKPNTGDDIDIGSRAY